MTLSYNWLADYIPQIPDKNRLSKILTSIGLEVESMENYESLKGGLSGLITGQILTCEKHPGADKLKLTTVDIGNGNTLKIVCGAPNAAAGQKVVVAPVDTVLHPVKGETFSIKKSKIRGEESEGMLCAEDEIGLGEGHEGIMVLPPETEIGKPVAGLFNAYSDVIYEIGLTPNRMDAMSHLGVARDVIAYLNHHDKAGYSLKSPLGKPVKGSAETNPISVEIENNKDCQRYAGITIQNITVKESPDWLRNKLKAIGLRPINNIVDITNFILHETGQPLHAFDSDKIKGNRVIVKNLKAGTVFLTLDDKEKKLAETDLIICNAEEGMCIAGVYGGKNSGVTDNTRNIFLESAWFSPVAIRKTSYSLGLRTDAASRFEKGVDISQTLQVLKRATQIILDLAGGQIAGDFIDVYPAPQQQKTVSLKYFYLKKLSGKNYHPEAVKSILHSLGFEVMKEGANEWLISVPFSKPDVTIPADIVEEIMRIDGLDNIEIPGAITISPSVDNQETGWDLQEKIANQLAGSGFTEIFTNSITNSNYYDESLIGKAVKMINNLSADLDILRPAMLETGLNVLSHNINRKNNNLLFFEFGKVYHTQSKGSYSEKKHLALYATGNIHPAQWNQQAGPADFYFMKGVVENVLRNSGFNSLAFTNTSHNDLDSTAEIMVNNKAIGFTGIVTKKKLQQFGIKEQVVFADLDWDLLLSMRSKKKISYREISRFPPVSRDLAIVLDSNKTFAEIESATRKAKLPQLQQVRLFDIFENEKLGANKKSMAVNYTFMDETKTLTDSEIDGMMQQLIRSYEKELSAEIRKQ